MILTLFALLAVVTLAVVPSRFATSSALRYLLLALATLLGGFGLNAIALAAVTNDAQPAFAAALFLFVSRFLFHERAWQLAKLNVASAERESREAPRN